MTNLVLLILKNYSWAMFLGIVLSYLDVHVTQLKFWVIIIVFNALVAWAKS